MRVPVPIALALLLLLQSAWLSAEDSDAPAAEGDDVPAVAVPEERSEAAATDPPDRGDDRFLPTDRLRYDQEVDYPTDI